MTDKGSNQPDSKFNRRKVMKTIFSGTVASPIAYSGIATAQGDSRSPKQTLSKTRREATDDEVNNFVDSKVFQEFIKRMRIPQYDTSSIEVIEVQINKAELAKTIEVETKYGTISGILGSENPAPLIFKPDENKIPRGLKNQYSGSSSWLDHQNTLITINGPGQPIIYVRGASDTETKHAVEAAHENGANGEPTQTLVATTTKDSSNEKLKLKADSEIWTVYKDSTYKFDSETLNYLDQVDTNKLLGVGGSGRGVSTLAPSCDEQAISCGLDLITAFPNCVFASVGCSLATVGAGGCILIVLAICVPGGAVSIYSCASWCRNCSSRCGS